MRHWICISHHKKYAYPGEIKLISNLSCNIPSPGTFTDDEICDLQEIEVYPKKPLHLPLPKGSPLKQFLRVTLRKLIESGSGPYYEREFFSQKPACPRDSLEQVAQIEVVQVVHVFYILALAMVICLILLVVEQIYYRFHKRRERVAPYMS